MIFRMNLNSYVYWLEGNCVQSQKACVKICLWPRVLVM